MPLGAVASTPFRPGSQRTAGRDVSFWIPAPREHRLCAPGPWAEGRRRALGGRRSSPRSTGRRRDPHRRQEVFFRWSNRRSESYRERAGSDGSGGDGGGRARARRGRRAVVTPAARTRTRNPSNALGPGHRQSPAANRGPSRTVPLHGPPSLQYGSRVPPHWRPTRPEARPPAPERTHPPRSSPRRKNGGCVIPFHAKVVGLTTILSKKQPQKIVQLLQGR